MDNVQFVQVPHRRHKLGEDGARVRLSKVFSVHDFLE
jgi:hypothetical protein